MLKVKPHGLKQGEFTWTTQRERASNDSDIWHTVYHYHTELQGQAKPHHTMSLFKRSVPFPTHSPYMYWAWHQYGIEYPVGLREPQLLQYCCWCTIVIAIDICCSSALRNPTTEGSSKRLGKVDNCSFSSLSKADIPKAHWYPFGSWNTFSWHSLCQGCR